MLRNWNGTTQTQANTCTNVRNLLTIHKICLRQQNGGKNRTVSTCFIYGWRGERENVEAWNIPSLMKCYIHPSAVGRICCDQQGVWVCLCVCMSMCVTVKSSLSVHGLNEHWAWKSKSDVSENRCVCFWSSWEDCWRRRVVGEMACQLTLSSTSGFKVKKCMPVRKSEISTNSFGHCSHPYSLKLFVKFMKQEWYHNIWILLKFLSFQNQTRITPNVPTVPSNTNN